MVCGQIIAVAGINARIMIFTRIGYRLLLAIEAVPAGVGALTPLLLPESPHYFVKHGSLTKATAAYTRLLSKEKAEPPVYRLTRALEHERDVQESAEAPSFKECFHGANWGRTRIIWYANMLQSFVGIAMIQNAAYFLELGGMSAQNSLNVTTASLCLLLPAVLLSWYLMALLGRRTILLWGASLITVLWLGIGIACCSSTTTAFWFVGCAKVTTYFVHGLSVGGIVPVVASETSSLRLRAKTQAMGFTVQLLISWVFQYVVPYMYSTAEGNLGGKVGFISAGLSAVALVVIFFEIPEMKGLRVEELDTRFEQKVSTRAFQHAANALTEG